MQNLPTVGPMSKPRRERTQEYDVAPTCWALGNQLCLLSMIATLISLLPSSRYKPIGRDRRRLLIGPGTIIIA
jgi:hypothetical protein